MAGLKKNHFISNSISLNLVNTEENRRGKRYDLLENDEQVSHWLDLMFTERVILTEQFSQRNQYTHEEVSALRELRSFLRKGFQAIADGLQVDEQWVHTLESYRGKAPLTFVIKENRLLPVPSGTFANALLSLIAYDALELLVSGKLETIKRCSNPRCIWLFMDTTGKRKWCSMKICGNRMKVARHEHRA
ncbi:Putative stress-induced transcription regulator [Paenibacillus sophorae]|uniref:CGNR zinc finger domain-containing protein n=1 Tax=Paenibacillus sophorae TaxID=1333845 RepID=A0A1H8F8J7_9BACL|nr:CGNR zinc finger domain-containing protein [Paenibacillus sophorae]QWU13786.1 CGNR zinc finger domain-containing protein [Paenibacillus sophorae]SEN27537.1 Putative stress-induced transcription regulator [Paenibacillus sophorae]